MSISTSAAAAAQMSLPVEPDAGSRRLNTAKALQEAIGSQMEKDTRLYS